MLVDQDLRRVFELEASNIITSIYTSLVDPAMGEEFSRLELVYYSGKIAAKVGIPTLSTMSKLDIIDYLRMNGLTGSPLDQVNIDQMKVKTYDWVLTLQEGLKRKLRNYLSTIETYWAAEQLKRNPDGSVRRVSRKGKPVSSSKSKIPSIRPSNKGLLLPSLDTLSSSKPKLSLKPPSTPLRKDYYSEDFVDNNFRLVYPTEGDFYDKLISRAPPGEWSTLIVRVFAKLWNGVNSIFRLYSRNVDSMYQTKLMDFFQIGQISMWPGESLVYKVPSHVTACKQCLRIHLTSSGEFRLFMLQDIQGNSNVNERPTSWVFTVGPVHPYCYCVLHNAELDPPKFNEPLAKARIELGKGELKGRKDAVTKSKKRLAEAMKLYTK